MRRLRKSATLLALSTLALAGGGCAPRLRVDPVKMKPIESIAPVTFIANRFVRSPVRTADELPSDPTLSTAISIFEPGVPAFFEALNRTERFKIVEKEKVLGAAAYAKFPILAGASAGSAQLAEGWRVVTPDDGAKIAALLAEIDADAALITYWRFTLEVSTAGVGVMTASPRASLRAWLIGRDGTVVADDEVNTLADESIGMHSGRYDRKALSPLFADAIETCAVKLIVDLSNARMKARNPGDG